ncbi:hypothetical protein CDAR_301701, partial [Caerostris darwini]
ISAQNSEDGLVLQNTWNMKSGKWYEWVAGLRTTPELWERRILSKQIGLEFHSFFCLKAYAVPVTGDSYYEQSEDPRALSSAAFQMMLISSRDLLS